MNALKPLSIVLGLIAIAFSSEATAQQIGNQIPSVVQLPSFQIFTYNGTVLVPDSGAGFLGGNRSASITSRRRGLNRAFGSSFRNPHLTVHPTIIDNNEIDRQLLGGTPKEFLASKVKEETEGGKKAATKHKAIDPNEEGKALVRYARKQYREGKDTAAFDTYRMAIGVLSGRLKELATLEFRRVFGSAADQSLRMASARR